MGNGSAFLIGKFDEYITVKYVAGIKVITRRDKKDGQPDNNPMHSHTANTMYAHLDRETGKVVQVSVYKDNVKVKDIDWGHQHGKYKKGETHVHVYVDGIRQKGAVEPSEEDLLIAETVRSEDDG